MVATPKAADWHEYNREADNTEVVISRVRLAADQEHAVTSISASIDTTASSLLDLFGLSKVGVMDLTDTDVLDLATEIFTFAGHGLAEAEKLVFHTNGDTAPTGLTSGTTYFAKTVTTDTFKLAATSGGAAIDLSGTQSSFAEEAVILPLSKSWQVYDHFEVEYPSPLQASANAPLILKIAAVASVQGILNMSGFSV